MARDQHMMLLSSDGAGFKEPGFRKKKLQGNAPYRLRDVGADEEHSEHGFGD